VNNINYVTGVLVGRQREVRELFKCDLLALIGSFADGLKKDPLELVVCPATCKEALRVYLSGEFPLTRIRIKRVTEARIDELEGAIYIIGDDASAHRFKVEIE
jgi:hypothetical protein